MSAQQPEAMRLAEALDSRREPSPTHYTNQAASELRRLHAANLDCMAWYEAAKAERDDLLAVVRGFRQKLATYVSVYPGDKQLRRLLDECDAAIIKAGGAP